MIKFGYRQFTSNRWESIWIDLFEDPQILRKRLNGKWRNMLKNAERQNLRFEVHIDADNYEWLVNNCDQMMTERGKTFPVKLYQQLQLEFKAENLSTQHCPASYPPADTSAIQYCRGQYTTSSHRRLPRRHTKI